MEHEGEGQDAAGRWQAHRDLRRGQITPAAPAPLDQIKDRWRATMPPNRAPPRPSRTPAKVLAAMAKGTSLADALKGLGTLPPAQPMASPANSLPPCSSGRQSPAAGPALRDGQGHGQAARSAQQGRLLRRLAQGRDARCHPAGDPFLAQASKQFGLDMGRELAEELRVAIRNTVGVTRNETALRALNAKLVGNQ
jgi:peptidyl-prolyl cis-trans isomerase D